MSMRMETNQTIGGGDPKRSLLMETKEIGIPAR
jgi:hypothetical protein